MGDVDGVEGGAEQGVDAVREYGGGDEDGGERGDEEDDGIVKEHGVCARVLQMSLGMRDMLSAVLAGESGTIECLSGLSVPSK